MNIVITLDQFQTNNIYLKPAIENNIIEDSKFIKIIYSNNLMTLNSLFIHFPLKKYSIETYFKKNKYIFDIEANKKTLDSIFTIEENILKMFTSNKCKKYIIKQSLSNGFLKIYPNHIENNESVSTDEYGDFIIKISGIWETNDECGVNYKIILS